MKIKLEDFRGAFEICDSVQASPVMDSSQFVRLKQNASELTISLTGILRAEAKVTSAVPGGKWTSYVERRILKAFLSTSKSADIEFFYKDKLTLKTDQRLEVAPHTVISGYETWTPNNLFDLEPEQTKALRTAVKYLPHTAGTDHVDAICFCKDYGVVVTDTLFMMGILGSPVKTDFFLPGSLAKVLSGNPNKIAADKTGVGIGFSSGFVFQPLSSDLDRYPVNKCKSMIEEALQASRSSRLDQEHQQIRL